ncbi:MAG TPA: hypothetical protein VK456_13350 [Xanthobacteraceae bacterium]|nr:hypothetical protein [Xanthobacteraceae bacterium]
MRLVVGFGVGALAAVAIVAADMASGIRTASAQGGIVCEYGTARYKRCCRESYRNNPDLGPRARARDIDACMSGSSSREPESGERKTSRTRDDRGSASAGLRRLDCSADGCNGGCAEDEVVVSAFCPSGAPTVDGDRDVKCAEGRERPAVLVCAKR